MAAKVAHLRKDRQCARFADNYAALASRLGRVDEAIEWLEGETQDWLGDFAAERAQRDLGAVVTA